MAKKRVVYIINAAPNYRDKFLRELGKYVDLTVVSFSGKKYNLKDPDQRQGYKFIELKHRSFLGISWNISEFRRAAGDYDVIMVGFILRNIFRLLNIFRNKRVIAEGLIYGKNDNYGIRFARKFLLNKCEGVLVYSQMVKDKLEKEIKKPIISFNNTSFSREEITPLPYKNLPEKNINILWVGRYTKRKKVERLIKLANKDIRINLRLIGPKLSTILNGYQENSRIEIFGAAYDNELREHFEWCHLVLNPGGAGLLVMNAGRFARPIVIDNNSHHGPEIQLAVESSQHFIDFGNTNEIEEVLNRYFKDPSALIEEGKHLSAVMYEKFTIEFMVSQYLRAIEGQWNES